MGTILVFQRIGIAREFKNIFTEVSVKDWGREDGLPWSQDGLCSCLDVGSSPCVPAKGCTFPMVALHHVEMLAQ